MEKNLVGGYVFSVKKWRIKFLLKIIEALYFDYTFV